MFAGNYIESRLRNSKAKIVMQVDGVAFSMGAFLLTAADERVIVSNGFVMIHQASGSTRGTAKEHRTATGVLDDMNENFINGLIRITGKTRKAVLKWFDGDNYFNAAKALKEGIVDRVVDPVIDIKLDDKKAMEDNDLFGRFSALLTHNNNSNLNQKQTMKKELIEKFGLVGVSAESSDTAVLEAMQKHISSQTTGVQAKFDGLKTEYDALKTKVEGETKTKIDALLKPLEGKLDAKKIETYRAIGEKSGIDALQVALEGVKGRKSIASFIEGKEGASAVDAKAGWDWDKYQKEDPRALEKLATENADAYNALYDAKFKQ